MSARDRKTRVIHEQEIWSAHSDLISLRTSEAMRAKRIRGEYIGGRAPFGYQVAPDGRTLEPNPAEQAVIIEARALRTAGMSLRRIAALLASRGVRARSGAPLGLTQVARMVSTSITEPF